jgi:hypothetical protein
MVERRGIDYRKNIVTPLAEKTPESANVVFCTSTRVKLLLEMRKSGLINLEGNLLPKSRELVEKAGERLKRLDRFFR